jgi:cation diffusion facilitator CzcD-associated flavoprotein CzcO
MAKTLSVGIIGAGPGGLALGILLRKAGFDDFTVFDREEGVGGTWRINKYPGLACDVKSHLYSFSFVLNANWSRLWSVTGSACRGTGAANHRAVTPSSWSVTLQTSEEVSR